MPHPWLADLAVKFGTTFLSYGMVHIGDDPPVWAGVRVTFAIKNDGGAAITLFDPTLEQETGREWKYATSNPRGGIVGGRIIQPGQRIEVTKKFRAFPGEPEWPGATSENSRGRARIQTVSGTGSKGSPDTTVTIGHQPT